MGSESGGTGSKGSPGVLQRKRNQECGVLNFFFFFFYVYSFLRDRESTSGEGQREKETESEAGSRL